MLSLPGRLPPGALLPEADQPITAALAEAGALWFSFDAALATVEGDVITGLRSRTGAAHARPTEANTGHGLLARHRGADVLATTARQNGGFVLSDRVDCGSMGMAVIWDAPAGPGETLWCVEAQAGDSGVVLEDRGGSLRLSDRKGEAEVICPAAPGAAMQVAFATVTPDILSLMLAEGAPATGRFPGSFRPGPCDVFIACRRGRAGLWNTLGTLRLGDLILFPDHDICAPEARPLRDRLRRYAREVFHGL